MSFDSRVFERVLNVVEDSPRHEKLMADCKLADSVSTEGDTFWLPAGAQPKSSLEVIAKSIFDFHTKGLVSRPEGCTNEPTKSYYNVEASGAEWWVQIREAGLGGGGDEAGGLPFHWDKDEGMRRSADSFVFPSLSTVTYLTKHGAPTLVFEARATECGLAVEEELRRAYLSYPEPFKHLCFDGRYLHAVLGSLERCLGTQGAPALAPSHDALRSKVHVCDVTHRHGHFLIRQCCA
ncbi:unnamed protein product [Discosporangium mesarthrocarpum]